MIAGGHNIRDAMNNKAKEKLLHITPASLMAVRMGIAFEVLSVGGVSYQDDTPGAYTKAYLRGPPVLLELPRNFRPKPFDKYVRPVMKLVKALYGLPRAGLDWGMEARQRLDSSGFKHVRDTGEDSVFIKEYADGVRIVVVLYTDDLLVAGSGKRALQARKELRQVLGIPDKGDVHEQLKDFIGVERQVVFRSPRRVVLHVHQAAYAAAMAKSFEAEFNNGQELSIVTTPMKIRYDEVDARDEELPGVFELAAADHLGKFQWLVRGSRPDLAFAGRFLATRVTKWCKTCDAYLIRCYKYLKGTITLGLLYSFDPTETDRRICLSYAGSDHAGDPHSSRSVSGWLTYLSAPSGSMLVDGEVHSRRGARCVGRVRDSKRN